MRRRGTRGGWPATHFGVDPGDGRSVGTYNDFLKAQGSSLGELIESLGGPPAPPRAYSGTLKPFGEARAWAQSLGLSSLTAWKQWLESNDRPDGIPATPSKVYEGQGWKGWGDWLGTGNVHPSDRKWRPFHKAKSFARSLGIKNRRAWTEWARSEACPEDIPVAPNMIYRGAGWIGYGDWLGTDRRARVLQPRTFKKARDFVHSLGLSSRDGWVEWCASGARPDDIPVNPGSTYAGKGWKGFGDWLGTGTVAVFNKKFRSFEKARAYVRSLGLRGEEEWREWAKLNRPADIPSTPAAIYKDKGWKNLADWLGSGRVSNRDREWLPFEEARAFVMALNFHTEAEYHAWSKAGTRPINIPSDPARIYVDTGWCGWKDWLGKTGLTGPTPGQKRVSLTKCRAISRDLKSGVFTRFETAARNGVNKSLVTEIALGRHWSCREMAT
jgi:hypothetical protein